MSSVGAAAATTYMPLRQLQTLIRQGLAAEGLQAAGANVSLAARFVQSGLISLDDAIRALALGVQYPNKVMKEMGVTAKTAAQSLREMVKQIVGVGTTAGGAVPPSIVPPGGALLGGLPEPGRVLALSEALNTTRKSTAGLMQSLLSLRWQIFTVMFFFYMLSNAASSAWSRLQGGARIIDQVRTGLALLSAIGIKNAIELGRQIQEASGYTMSFAEIIGVMARSAIRGVSAEVVKLVPQLMRYAQLLSIITGGAETSEQVLTKMLEAIQRGQVRLAVTVGATSGSMTNILEIFKRTADEAKNAEGPVGELTRMLLDTGIMAAKGAESLTPWQKQLLVAWQIVQLAEQAVGGMGDEFDATSRKINTFSRALEEVGKAIWTSITNAFAPISQELGRFIYAIAGAFVVWKELFGAMLDYMATGGAEEHLRRIDAVVQEYQQTVREVSTSTIPTLKDAYIGLARFGQLKVFATQAQDGEKMVEVNKSALDSLMKILGMTTNLTEAEEERSRGIAEQSELMIQSLKSYMDYLLEVEREEQDIARRRARDWEDLEIERRRKIEDIERSFAKEREQAQRQYDDRRQEAQRDLARRLAQIERDLANKLRDIWRDYNDKLFEATAERNAIMALMAQRERDRRIQEAYEWAADARQTAYEQYQDTVENERRQLEDRLRQIADNRAQEYEELRIWYERRRQDMLLAYAREDEDARIARERRMADLMRQYQWELVQHRVKNDQLLTQEQRYLQLALALRNMYEQLIGKPIVIPVYLQHYSLPSLPREPVTGQRPRARMAGGVDIVTRPTLFLAHPGEAVATVPMYRASPLPVSVDGTVRHSVRAMVDARVAGMEGRIANAVMLALANVFRRA
ncbi:hypothetical protein [Thermogutta sp.]|uniref:hypothetical protein n=1 Tax=Thermogutta sp. TaxID=1962930 RepID=UPI00322065EB